MLHRKRKSNAGFLLEVQSNMAQNQRNDSGPAEPKDHRGRPARPLRYIFESCRTDDVSLIKHALHLASLPGCCDNKQETLERAVLQAVIRKSENVLSYVLAEGGPVPDYSDLPGEELPTIRFLEILLAHGWNINARGYDGKGLPFLWQAVADYDLTVWALDHGASIHPGQNERDRSNESQTITNISPPLLENAVCLTSEISTIDLLYSKGAPVTEKVLHFAAGKAGACAPPGERSLASGRVTLVRHLLDNYNLDVNAFEMPWGTPLCYVAHMGSTNISCEDVVELLLERGANPDLSKDPPGWSAVTLAAKHRNFRFLEAIESWSTKRTAGS